MITNITAYWIGGEYYLHEGTPNANTKKKITRRIQENKKAIERGETHETIDSYSFVDGWEEAKETQTQNNIQKEKIKWPQ